MGGSTYGSAVQSDVQTHPGHGHLVEPHVHGMISPAPVYGVLAFPVQNERLLALVRKTQPVGGGMTIVTGLWG